MLGTGTINIVANLPTQDDRADLRARLTRLRTMQKGADLRKTRFEWVYIVQADSPDELIKIGRAYRIEVRLAVLQSQCPVPLKVRGLFIAPRGAELALHELWSGSRVNGEWFIPDAQIIDSLSSFPKAKRMAEVEFLKFCVARNMHPDRVRKLLYAGVRRKNRKSRRRSLAVAA
jgi:hypothetical protein